MSEEAKTLEDTEPILATAGEEPLKIESDIPIPLRASRFKWGADMERMRVGDSVWFADKTDGAYFASLLNRFGNGYLTEPETKGKKNGLRVWKVRKKPVRKSKAEALVEAPGETKQEPVREERVLKVGIERDEHAHLGRV